MFNNFNVTVNTHKLSKNVFCLGSRKLKAVVESEEVRSAISKACSGPPPPMRSIKDGK